MGTMAWKGEGRQVLNIEETTVYEGLDSQWVTLKPEPVGFLM